jgi:NAD(P)-dependent dehydrogenase (short-subunit alcohol dehydrogenase family)
MARLGANGYIALHVVQSLLEKGYRVRGTVRSESKAKHLHETFQSYGDALQVVVVSDITKVRRAPMYGDGREADGLAMVGRRVRRIREGRRCRRAYREPVPHQVR